MLKDRKVKKKIKKIIKMVESMFVMYRLTGVDLELSIRWRAKGENKFSYQHEIKNVDNFFKNNKEDCEGMTIGLCKKENGRMEYWYFNIFFDVESADIRCYIKPLVDVKLFELLITNFKQFKGDYSNASYKEYQSLILKNLNLEQVEDFCKQNILAAI